MFDDNYVCEPKGIPLVSYYKEIKNAKAPYVFTTLHYHSDFELLYIVSGSATMTVSGETFTVGIGSLVFINPFEVHYGEVLSSDFSYYCIDFDVKMLSLPSEESLLSEEMKYMNHVVNPDMLKYVSEICRGYEKEPSGWMLYVKGLLYVLFSLFDENLVKSMPSKETEFSKKIIGYVRDNYMKSISSEDAAAYVSYNQSYFCRVFKKTFSCTFGEYLSLYRIKKAKDYLRTENISTTAMLCGFGSISYFSVEFKKICGVSPLTYKKSMRDSVFDRFELE